MSDSCTVIVDRDVTAAAAPDTARALLDRLVADGIVLPEPEPDRAFGPGHPPGPNAPHEARRYRTNGVTIDIGRAVHGLGPAVPGAECPTCGESVPEETLMVDLLPGWVAATVTEYDCAECGATCAPEELDWYDPVPVVGGVAVTFWNWPPEVEALAEMFAEVTGHRFGVGHDHR